MDLLPTSAAPGVAERADALADAACDLHDAASTPASWSADAVEDAVEAIETTALALAAAHPDAGAAMLTIGHTLAQLREHLGLPAPATTGATRPRPRIPGRMDCARPYRVRTVDE